MAEDELRKLLKERYSATVEMLKPYSEIMKKMAEYVIYLILKILINIYKFVIA